MNKIGLTAVMVAGILGSTMGGVLAQAEEVENKDSNSNVGFTTPADGGLKLMEVADLSFGNHEISASDEIYKTQSDTKSTVQDLRGTETGWELRVAQNGQFLNGKKELTNAQITLDKPELNIDSTAIANLKTNVVLNPNGDATVIMDANTGEGNGLATENFNTGSASLSVPGKTTKIVGQYTTTLNWTLMDAVGNE